MSGKEHARSVVHLWPAPKVVRDWLRGNEDASKEVRDELNETTRKLCGVVDALGISCRREVAAARVQWMAAWAACSALDGDQVAAERFAASAKELASEALWSWGAMRGILEEYAPHQSADQRTGEHYHRANVLVHDGTALKIEGVRTYRHKKMDAKPNGVYAVWLEQAGPGPAMTCYKKLR